MARIIFDMIVMAFVGGLVGGGIKFFQWVGADLTFGILVSMPTSDSILPMILKSAVIGAVIGLFIGIFQVIVEKRQWDLGGSYTGGKSYDNQYYRDESEDEFGDIGECERGYSSWKKEQYMDASGAWRMPGDDYKDASGAWRKPGEQYKDASGAWRNPDDDYIDESGAWRKPGDKYIDHSGGWRS